MVLLYHFDVPYGSGGFLGVDVFFVLSGYLITSQLWTRWCDAPTELWPFWRGRLRRLLPAVLALLVVTTAAMLALDRAGLRRHLADVVAAASYTSNWWYVADARSYAAHWQAGRPPVLQHLWSLAIEEQFYLLWPLVVAGLLRLTHRRPNGYRLFTLVAALLALASATWLGVGSALAHVPEPLSADGDPLRWYYGTDSHAVGLLAGAALAFARRGAGFGVTGGGRALPALPAASPRVGLVGVLGLVVLLAMVPSTAYHTAWLYRVGFALAALATLALVVAVTRPGPLQGFFSLAPLRWLGRRSYAIYLWHWPVACFTAPGVALRVVVTLLLAEASYRLVETPVRRHGWRVSLRRLRAGGLLLPLALTVALVMVGGGVVAALTPTPVRGELSAQQIEAADLDPHVEVPSTSPVPPTVRPSPAATPRPTARPTTTAQMSLDYYGDSFAIAAAPALRKVFRQVDLHAAVGEQSWQLLPALTRDAARVQSDVVVVHTGNNGTVREEQLRAALAALAELPRVVVVLPSSPRPWTDRARDTLAEVCGTPERPKLANVRVVDWAGAAADDPRYFSDGVHPSVAGVELYTRLVQVAAVRP